MRFCLCVCASEQCGGPPRCGGSQKAAARAARDVCARVPGRASTLEPSSVESFFKFFFLFFSELLRAPPVHLRTCPCLDPPAPHHSHAPAAAQLYWALSGAPPRPLCTPAPPRNARVGAPSLTLALSSVRGEGQGGLSGAGRRAGAGGARKASANLQLISESSPSGAHKGLGEPPPLPPFGSRLEITSRRSYLVLGLGDLGVSRALH